MKVQYSLTCETHYSVLFLKLTDHRLLHGLVNFSFHLTSVWDIGFSFDVLAKLGSLGFAQTAEIIHRRFESSAPCAEMHGEKLLCRGVDHESIAALGLIDEWCAISIHVNEIFDFEFPRSLVLLLDPHGMWRECET